MKRVKLLIALLLTAATAFSALTGCNPSDPANEGITTQIVTDTEKNTEEITTAAETEPAFVGMIFDATARIVIPADADEIIRNAANMVAAAITEKAGMTLPVVSADQDGDTDSASLTLAVGSFETERAYSLTAEGKSLCLEASDSTTLYYAAKAVLDAWLTPDFGLVSEGVLTLPQNRMADLNGLTTKLDHSIRVLSQNVRVADDPDGNSVAERTRRLRDLLEEYRPDLIGTQETSDKWMKQLNGITRSLAKRTDLGEYGMVGCSREGREATSGEWNTILYRKDRFELLDSDTTWLSDTPNEASAVEGSLCKRICTWALLKDKQTGETILFANTHLDHGTDEVRRAQMDILMNYLADRIGQYPFYLTGDFNCQSDSLPYQTATSRLQDSHVTGWMDHSTVNRTYHGYQETGGSEIDFIFHNEKTTPVNYEIISKGYDGYVSDHFGVIVEFVNG